MRFTVFGVKMDKKYVIKIILLNTLWIVWICLSVLFGYLIANRFFPDMPALFIPFSLIFLLIGGGVAFLVLKLRKKKNSALNQQKQSTLVQHTSTDQKDTTCDLQGKATGADNPDNSATRTNDFEQHGEKDNN